MKAEAVAPFRRSRISPGHRAPVEREGATCAIQELKMRQKGQGGVGAATTEPVRERMVTEVGRRALHIQLKARYSLRKSHFESAPKENPTGRAHAHSRPAPSTAAPPRRLSFSPARRRVPIAVPTLPLVRRRARDVTGRLGAGWRLYLQQRLGFSPGRLPVASRFPQSRRHAPGAGSAALPARAAAAALGTVRPGAASVAAAAAAVARCALTGAGLRAPRSRGGWCSAAAPRPAPAVARAVRGQRGCAQPERGPHGRLPVSCVPKTRGRSLSSTDECNSRAGRVTARPRRKRDVPHNYTSKGARCQHFESLFGQASLQGKYYRCTKKRAQSERARCSGTAQRLNC
nr:uncharacterized protein LOC116286000 [Vicugna pacos]